MKIYITDVSVLFDLYSLGILPEFFALDAEIHLTAFVYNEVTRKEQILEFENFKRAKKLHIITLSEEDEEAINNMSLQRSNRSFSDRSMLYKAIQLKVPLLTADGKLRKEAEEMGVTVYGSLWVIEQMNIQKILTKEMAAEHLKKLLQFNDRMKQELIINTIKKLK